VLQVEVLQVEVALQVEVVLEVEEEVLLVEVVVLISVVMRVLEVQVMTKKKMHLQVSLVTYEIGNCSRLNC
jgi:hypothetical protein